MDNVKRQELIFISDIYLQDSEFISDVQKNMDSFFSGQVALAKALKMVGHSNNSEVLIQKAPDTYRKWTAIMWLDDSIIKHVHVS